MAPQNQAVQNVSTFNNPIQAEFDGKPVRILAIGDQEGKSPVYLAVDESGRSMWESLTQFTITDPHALPASMRGRLSSGQSR